MTQLVVSLDELGVEELRTKARVLASQKVPKGKDKTEQHIAGLWDVLHALKERTGVLLSTTHAEQLTAASSAPLRKRLHVVRGALRELVEVTDPMAEKPDMIP